MCTCAYTSLCAFYVCNVDGTLASVFLSRQQRCHPRNQKFFASRQANSKNTIINYCYESTNLLLMTTGELSLHRVLFSASKGVTAAAHRAVVIAGGYRKWVYEMCTLASSELLHRCMPAQHFSLIQFMEDLKLMKNYFLRVVLLAAPVPYVEKFHDMRNGQSE